MLCWDIQRSKIGTSIHFSRTDLHPSKGEDKQILEFIPLQNEKYCLLSQFC